MIWKKILSYLTFWKKQPEPEQGSSSYLKMMHGINKLSILMFVIAMGVLIYRILLK
ncbi:MAG: hypothetical protein LPK45_07240 [Bacteroidota bacterium]|nr:hypothetical protein [Bacteroidota bacterium]